MESSTRLDTSAMWTQIQRMPFQQLQETTDFAYIEKVMTLVGRYVFSEGDTNMADHKCTISVAKLLKIVCSKSLQELERLRKVHNEGNAELANAKRGFSAQLQAKDEEIEKLNKTLHAMAKGDLTQAAAEHLTTVEELARVKAENDVLTLKVQNLTRQTDELKQTLASRSDDRNYINDTYDKAQLEYRHLAARYKRLTDRFAKTEDMLEEMRRKERTKKLDITDELQRIRNKVQSLQQENCSLVQSRDRAEELCEKREAEALRDMTELRRLNKDLLDEERSKNQVLRDEFLNAKEEADTHVEQLLQQHELDLDEKEQELAILRRQLEKAVSKRRGRFNSDNSSSADDSSSGSISQNGKSSRHEEEEKENTQHRMRGVSSEEQRKVERENDDLRAEVEQLELRIDALDEENRRLTRLVKNYESGNEGLYRLRQELADQTRTVEMLQGENSQLRERLNGMEDSITFNAALRELCKRVGVTESEINSLRPQNATAYSEMDTLKEEVSLLKEEVEWLEKERRYWMNKVRLQPLMDTKLRFELGLTSEQLKQLDRLVDQMKSGSVVVEDNDESYKDKYFKELQARHRDAEQFSTYVKQRINDALKDAFVDVSSANTAAAVSQLRDHIDVITATPSAEANAKAEEKIRTMTQRLEELERAEKTHSEEVARLREQVVAGNTEKEVISRERDQYREAIFGAAGVGGSDGGDGTDTPALGDFGETSTGRLSNAKWLKVSNTLREQLRSKDTLIDTLGKEMTELKEKLEAERQHETEVQQAMEKQKTEFTTLQDQINALTVLNEEATEKCKALSRVNKDLEDGLEHLDGGAAKEALLKVVLLRRREATLLQRLRRALSAQEETAASEDKLKSQVTSTLEMLRKTLEDRSSTGDVLPRSSSGCSMEGEMLNFLDSAVQHMLQGRLFREDSHFLIHLRQVYQGMESNEEFVELRLDAKRLRGELEEKQKAMDDLAAETEGLRAAAAAAEDAKANPSPEYANAARAKAEAEAATFKQKYALLAKRLEAREKEVTELESELDDARKEVVEARDHIRNILSDTADPQATSSGDAGRPRAKADATQVAHLEKEVARLKSVNLGLLHHSLDLQSQVKSVEIEVAAKEQEITLLKASADSPVVSSFVTAAIREHAALRRQSELALIQAKRLRMQLAATEANYHVVANEAMSYKLGAYRLYRKYVDQVVSTVDYLRCVQRASKGSLSPHQAEIMDRRLRKTISDLVECFGRNKLLAMQLSDAQNAFATLEQQLSLLHVDDGAAKRDAIDAKLQEARTRVREHERLMVECQEEQRFLQGKLSRAEATNKDLNAEVARLEFGHLAVSPLDEQLLATLLQLKESVFDKTVAPPLSIEAPSSPLSRCKIGGGGGLGGCGGDDGDVAIREYKSAILRETELAQQCAALKKQLADGRAEHRRAEQKATELREEAQQRGEQAAFAQRQLEEERQKAAQRETRLLRAYETQSDVARRATEHNVRCLQEMVQKKEQVIASLQEQLTTERQKYTEHELGEAVRMERLHEHMFRENTAMVERFKSAIETVGDSLRQTGGDGAEAPHPLLPSSGSGVEEQLAALTAETIRLRQQLKESRTTNAVLENQLENQIHQQLSSASAPPAGGGGAPQAATTTAATAAAPREDNTDALMGIVRNQTAMLESLRQREMHLSEELAREKEQRASAERRLDDALRQHVEQGGTLQLLSQVTGAAGDASLVSELRAQNAYLGQEVRGMQQALEAERSQARRFQMDAAEWKAHLDALQATVATQQVETARAEYLATLNEGLQTDLNAVKEQNDRLVLAASVLKQKLMEEAQRSGESVRQHQQEIALAQRMGTIQQESAGHMKVLDQRIRAIQKELNERVEKERGMLEKNTESQRLVYQLHQQLRAKEREVAELQGQLRARSSSATASPSPPRASPRSSRSSSSPLMENKGTQVLSAKTPSPIRGKENAVTASKATTPGGTTATTVTPPPHSSALQQQTPPLPSAPSASTAPGKDSDTASTRTALAPISAQDALLQPQIAGLVHRESQKQQRDNLAQISTLRSRVRRLEKDVEGAEEQLKGEREATRQLRLQLRQVREEQERKDGEYATQLAAAHHRRVNAEAQLNRQRGATAAGSAPSSPLPPPSSPSGPLAPGAMAAEEVASLREQVAAQERTIQRYQEELAEVAQASATATENVDPAYLASPSDIRAHVEEVRRLEGVIDGLRRRRSVEAPACENELRQQLTHANVVVQRMAADLAAMRGLPVSEIESIYSVSTTTTTTVTTTLTTEAELSSELLRKSNEVLDLRFKVETLELQVSRTQRHLNEILAVDTANAKAKRETSTDNVEALHNLVENLKLVIEKLQSENAQLRSTEAHSARFAHQSHELHDLRTRERDLQSQVQSLTQQLTHAHTRGPFRSGRTASSSPPPSTGPDGDVHRRLATAQAAAAQYETELDELRQRLSANDRPTVRPVDCTHHTTSPRTAAAVGVSSAARPTVPPPLPQSRFSQSHRQPGSLSSSSSGPLQRRLSSNRIGRTDDDLGSGDHASLAHHHLGQQ